MQVHGLHNLVVLFLEVCMFRITRHNVLYGGKISVRHGILEPMHYSRGRLYACSNYLCPPQA